MIISMSHDHLNFNLVILGGFSYFSDLKIANLKVTHSVDQ